MTRSLEFNEPLPKGMPSSGDCRNCPPTPFAGLGGNTAFERRLRRGKTGNRLRIVARHLIGVTVSYVRSKCGREKRFGFPFWPQLRDVNNLRTRTNSERWPPETGRIAKRDFSPASLDQRSPAAFPWSRSTSTVHTLSCSPSHLLKTCCAALHLPHSSGSWSAWSGARNHY